MRDEKYRKIQIEVSLNEIVSFSEKMPPIWVSLRFKESGKNNKFFSVNRRTSQFSCRAMHCDNFIALI